MNRAPCLGCGSGSIEHILSLGELPLANALLNHDEPGGEEHRYPLDLVLCRSCCLVQLGQTVEPELLFTDYPYFSSQSTTMVDHARDLVERLVSQLGLSDQDLVIEIASNDGYLLQHYVSSGIPAIGIDPAETVVAEARAKGVTTTCAFFTTDVANNMRNEGKRARILHANNVLAHVPDINDLVTAMASVLTEDGMAVVETPYVRELVSKGEFDTIYHEHVFYYSLTAVVELFRRNGLRVIDVERISIHGGSIRIFATPARADAPISQAVKNLLREEQELSICSPEYYATLSQHLTKTKQRLPSLIRELRGRGATVAAYGAAAKGAIMLNVTGLNAADISFVADRSPHKQGRYMPGTRVPILSPQELLRRRPDYVLLLAWNFAEEIMHQQQEYLSSGGEFILPLGPPMSGTD